MTKSASAPLEITSTATQWRAALGAIATSDGVRFCVWGPTALDVDLVVHEPGTSMSRRMTRDDRGQFTVVADLLSGSLYSYRIDKGDLWPDPASRCQPSGLHGPSAVVNPYQIVWTDLEWAWNAKPSSIYELHVGTFSREGTFAGVEAHLGELEALGVDTIELMPVAECAGRRNWGYDGVDLFAPSHHYGTPDDLRRLVDAAHRRGIAIILDVAYNHPSPDCAYLSAVSPHYFIPAVMQVPDSSGARLKSGVRYRMG